MVVRIALLVDGSHGLGIPKRFAQAFAKDFSFNGKVGGLSYEKAIKILLKGPHGSLEKENMYDFAWHVVLLNAKGAEDVTLKDYQSGLWAVKVLKN